MIYESNSYGKDIADDCKEFGSAILQGMIGGLLSKHRAEEHRKILKEYGCDGEHLKVHNPESGKKEWDAEKLEVCFQNSVCQVHNGLDSCLEDIWEKHNEYREEKTSRKGKRYNPNRGIFGNDPDDDVNTSNR